MKDKTTRLAEGIRKQHVAMSVAAGIARAQLVPNPVGVYDALHLSRMLEVMAAAIAQVAPIHAMDARTGEVRKLTEEDLEGASFTRGATTLALKDGTTIAGLSITRGDLRHAVVVLKTIGFRGAEADADKPDREPARAENVVALVAEIEQLLLLPFTPEYIDKVNRLTMKIVRAARTGPIVNHAMQLISALHHARVKMEKHSSAVAGALAALQRSVESQSPNSGSPG
jgi:hypothetical protein